MPDSPIELNEKICGTCRKRLPASSFHLKREAKDGLQPSCRDCVRTYFSSYKAANSVKINARDREWRNANRAEIAGRRREQKFGISAEQAAELLELQGQACAICGRAFTADLKPHVDHDHASGRVRGFLCTNCNCGIGQFRDDPVVLLAAADYITSRHALEEIR